MRAVPIQRVGGDHPRSRSLATAPAMACPIGSSTMACPERGPPIVAAVFHNVAAGLLAGAQRLDQVGPGVRVPAARRLAARNSHRHGLIAANAASTPVTPIRHRLETPAWPGGVALRRKWPPRQPHRSAEVGDDARRQQADQVRVA